MDELVVDALEVVFTINIKVDGDVYPYQRRKVGEEKKAETKEGKDKTKDEIRRYRAILWRTGAKLNSNTNSNGCFCSRS